VGVGLGGAVVSSPAANAGALAKAVSITAKPREVEKRLSKDIKKLPKGECLMLKI
jgi:hypothetical protein